jgi:hypothetical protein
MYLAADIDIEPGSQIDLIFALPEPVGAIIQAKGRVAWLNTNKNRKKPSLPAGFGVEFQSLTADELERIASYLEILFPLPDQL